MEQSKLNSPHLVSGKHCGQAGWVLREPATDVGLWYAAGVPVGVLADSHLRKHNVMHAGLARGAEGSRLSVKPSVQ